MLAGLKALDTALRVLVAVAGGDGPFYSPLAFAGSFRDAFGCQAARPDKACAHHFVSGSGGYTGRAPDKGVVGLDMSRPRSYEGETITPMVAVIRSGPSRRCHLTRDIGNTTTWLSDRFPCRPMTRVAFMAAMEVFLPDPQGVTVASCCWDRAPGSTSVPGFVSPTACGGTSVP